MNKISSLTKEQKAIITNNKKLQYIKNICQKNNVEIYLVGGCVRDLLLNQTPKDWDLISPSPPQKIKEVFKNKKILLHGEKFGTLGVMIYGEMFEITTFRREDAYLDYRRPSKVEFTTSLEADLSRRDFTINAMAISLFDNSHIVDYYDGLKDIKGKIIRCVGNSKIRFGEDALRILRAIRFACVLGFTIDKESSNEIFACKDMLLNIARERINLEINKILHSDASCNVLMKYKDVFEVLGFEIKNIKLIKKLESKNLKISQNDLFNIKLFLLDSHNFNIHKYDKKTLNLYMKITQNLDAGLDSLMDLKIALRIFKKYIFVFLGIKSIIENRNFDTLYKQVKSIENSVYDVSSLAIKGDTLKHLGYENHHIKDMLEMILKAIMLDKIQNTKQDILRFIENEKKS